MPIRGIRGAVTAEKDQPDAICNAVKLLLNEIRSVNPSLELADIASVFFTATADIHSDYPAHAAREIGWTQVPLLCAQEIPVSTGLPRCIRVLLHWNTDLPQSGIHHVYIGEAAILRPDL